MLFANPQAAKRLVRRINGNKIPGGMTGGFGCVMGLRGKIGKQSYNRTIAVLIYSRGNRQLVFRSCLYCSGMKNNLVGMGNLMEKKPT